MAAPINKAKFTQDINAPIKAIYGGGLMFSKDNLSNVISVDIVDNGQPFEVTGTVAGRVICSDGTTVPVDTGAISGNTVSLTLTEACFDVPGQIVVNIIVTNGDVKCCVLRAVYTVVPTETSAVVDPGNILPSITDLIDDIDAAVASIPADYSGLLASIAGTFSPSKPYVAGSYVWYDGTLYRFTAAHAAGSWTGSDATVVTIGGELADIKSAITSNNSFDVLSAYGDFKSRTHNGVVFTPIEHGFSVNRVSSATATAINNIYYNVSVLPDGVIPGRKIFLKYDSISTEVGFGVTFFAGGEAIATTSVYYGDAVIDVPDNAEGIVFRVQVLKGKSPDNVKLRVWVYPSIYNNSPYSEFKAADDAIQADVEALNVAMMTITGNSIVAQPDYVERSYLGENIGTNIKVLSYNIRGYKTDVTPVIYIPAEKVVNIEKLLFAKQPDFLTLQEDQKFIDGEKTMGTYEYIYYPMIPLSAAGTSEAVGCNIRSKTQFVERQPMVIRVADKSRTFRYGVVVKDNKTILIVSFHATAGSDAETVELRAAQYAALFDWISGDITLNNSSGNVVSVPNHTHTIIGMDGNSITADDKANLKSVASSHNCYALNGWIFGWMDTHKNDGAIDNIVVSNNIIVNNFEVLSGWYDDLFSDHYPLFADITLI